MKNTDLKQEQLHWKYLEEQKCWFLGKIVYCDNPENSREQCIILTTGFPIYFNANILN